MNLSHILDKRLTLNTKKSLPLEYNDEKVPLNESKKKKKKSIAGQPESSKTQQISKPYINNENDIKNYLFTPLFKKKPNFEEEDKNNELSVMDQKKNEVLALDFKIVGNFFIVVMYTSNDCVEKYIIIEKTYKLLFSIQLENGMFKYDKKSSEPPSIPKINCCLSDDAEQLVLGTNVTLFWAPLKKSIQNPSIYNIPIVNVKYLTKMKQFVFNKGHEISIGSPAKEVSLPKSEFYHNLIDFCVNNEETCLAVAAYMGEAAFGILFYNLQGLREEIKEPPFSFPLMNCKGICSICFESGSQRVIICDVHGNLGFVQFSMEDHKKNKYEITKKISIENNRLCAKIEMGPGDQFLWMMTQDGALFAVLPEFEKMYDVRIKSSCFVQNGDYFAVDWEIYKVRNEQKKFQLIDDRRILIKSELIPKQNENDLELLLLIWVNSEENAFRLETYDFKNWRLIEEKSINKLDFAFNWLKIKLEKYQEPQNEISLWLRETEGASQGLKFHVGAQSELKSENTLVAYQGNFRHNRIFLGLLSKDKSNLSGKEEKVWIKFYIFEKSIIINRDSNSSCLEHPAKVLDAKMSKKKKTLATITNEWIIYVWDLEFNNIVCKFDHQIENTKLINFIGENDEFLITNREVIRIVSVQRVLLFLSFFQSFMQFHTVEKGKEDEKASPLLDSVYMKQDKISKEFLENALKFGCLPYNYMKPMDFFNLENFYDKLLECMYVLKVNFKDFAHNTTGYDSFIKKYSDEERFKNCIKCVSAYKEASKPSESKIIGAEHFKNVLVLEEFNDIVKKQLWKVNENRIYLNLKKNEVLPFYAPDDKIYNDFLRKYNKYCGFNDGFDLHLVGEAFLKKNFFPIDVLEIWTDGNFVQKLISVFLFIFFYLICLISLPIVVIVMIYKILRLLLKFISARFQGNTEERKKQFAQIPDFRKLHIPNLFAHQESKDFLGTLAEKHPSDPVFKNFYIRSILHCKWIDMRNDFFVDMIQFLYFAILLSVEAVFLFPYRLPQMHAYNVSLVISCAVLALITWNFIQELIELSKVGKRIYRLGGIWNFFDWMVIIFTIPAFILDIIDMGLANGLEHDSKEATKVLMSISIIFTYLKLAGFARGFETTSFLIRMFIQVFVDMRNFIILLFYIVLALSFAAFVLQDMTSQDRFFLFNAVYSSMLGDSSGYTNLVSNDPWFLWIVHLIITIVLQIIALNLLISFIGGSYNKIIEIEDNAVVYEKMKLIMIYEAREAQLGEINKKKQSGFLYLVGSPGAFEEEEYLKDQSKTSEEIKTLTEKVLEIDSRVGKIMDNITIMMSKIDQMNDKLIK